MSPARSTLCFVGVCLSIGACSRSPRVDPEPRVADAAIQLGTSLRARIVTEDAATPVATPPSSTIPFTYTDLAGELSADGSFRAGAQSRLPTSIELSSPARSVESLRWTRSNTSGDHHILEQRWPAETQVVRGRLRFADAASTPVEFECPPRATHLSVLSFDPSTVLDIRSAGRTAQNGDVMPGSPPTTWRFVAARDRATAVRCEQSPPNALDDRAAVLVVPRATTVGPSLELGDLRWREVQFFERREGGTPVELGVSDCGFRFDDDARAPSRRAVAVTVHPSLTGLRSIRRWSHEPVDSDTLWTSREPRTDRVWLCVGAGLPEVSPYGETSIPRIDQRRFVVRLANRDIHAVIIFNERREPELRPTTSPAPTGIRCCRNTDGTFTSCDLIVLMARTGRPRFVAVPNVRRAGCSSVWEVDRIARERGPRPAPVGNSEQNRVVY